MNLKKSWHPSTRANLEKVYLAEIEAQKEKKKLEELQKEKRREREQFEIKKLKEAAGILNKQSERLDWMYSSSYSSNPVSNDTVANSPLKSQPDNVGKKGSTPKRWDLEAKIREDPLTRIKKSRK